MPSDSQSASTEPARTSARRGSPAAGRRHRHALHLEARLDDVAERKRRPQALAVALLGLLRIAADQRAVGEEVVREVLGARVAARPLEQLARERLGSLRPRRARRAPGRRRRARESRRGRRRARGGARGSRSNASSAAGVVSGVVDEEPAERVERRGELVSIAELAPELDRLVELRDRPRVGVATPGRERAGRRECPGARARRSRRTRRARRPVVRVPPPDARARARTSRARRRARARGPDRSRASQSSAARRSSWSISSRADHSASASKRCAYACSASAAKKSACRRRSSSASPTPRAARARTRGSSRASGSGRRRSASARLESTSAAEAVEVGAADLLGSREREAAREDRRAARRAPALAASRRS